MFYKSYKFFIIIFFSLFLTACATEGSFNPHLQNVQNAFAYLDKNTEKIPLLSEEKQRKAYQYFLQRYYSPWEMQSFLSIRNEIRQDSLSTIKAFIQHPGWNENKNPHSSSFFIALEKNMDLDRFPNRIKNAITVRPTYERGLPTNLPSFRSITKPGFGYPFDDLQNLFLPANLPVKIVHETKDKSWDLVMTNNSYGWVAANDLAQVDPEFIHAWKINQGYISVKEDRVAITDTGSVFQFMSYMGAIHPLVEIQKNHYLIKIVLRDPQGEILIKQSQIPKNKAYKIPLPLTPYEIAKVSNQFLGLPYGWGGLYGYRDCSMTLRDIFSYFGIWLPRTSYQQAHWRNHLISLRHLSNTEKQNLILKKGIPFFSVISMDGHIVLYLGKTNGQIYILHNFWGLHTRRLFKPEGRAVVGKTMITPLNFGKNYWNVKNSFLDRAKGLTVIREMYI